LSSWVQAGTDRGAGAVQVWEVKTRQELLTLPCREGLDLGALGLAFSPDGRWLAWTEDYGVVLRNALTGAPVRTFAWRPDQWILNSLAFSPDGRYMAGGRVDGTVDVWEVSAAADVSLLALVLTSPPTANLLVGAWALASQRSYRSFVAHRSLASSVTFNADSTLLATAGSDGPVKLWDTRTWVVKRTLAGHPGGAYCVAFSRKGKQLVVTGGSDAAVRVWDVKEDKEPLVLHGHTDAVYGVALSGDGRVASAGTDRTVKIWKLNPRREHWEAHP
jgi:WD40 repeat protein